MLARMDPRDDQRVWLERVLEVTKLAPTTLATRAKLAPTTLTRFLNNPEHATALSARTVAAIEQVAGLRFSDAPTLRLVREAEAEPYEIGEVSHNHYDAILCNALLKSSNVSLWTLRSRALESIGYVPGDILLVDLNEPPRRGDVVCAQIHDWQRMKAETVFRLFEPPYLVTATHDRALTAPKLIDKEVGIKGPVLLSVRPRASAA